MLRIKELLKEKGKTQIDLANELGVTPIGLNKMINGNPTLETLEKIANALAVDVSKLFNSEKIEDMETIYVKRNENYVPIGQINQLKDNK